MQVLNVLVERVFSPDTLFGIAVNGCDAAPPPCHTSHSALMRTQMQIEDSKAKSLRGNGMDPVT